MTLLGLLWVTYLPNLHLLFTLYQPLTLLTGVSLVTAGVQQPVGTDDRLTHGWGDRILPTKEIQKIQAQLSWTWGTVVDWQHWADTAAVAVVDDAVTDLGSALSARELPQAGAEVTCPAFNRYHYPSSTTTLAEEEEAFTIQVNDVVIGQVKSKAVADQVADQLRQAVPEIAANPSQLLPHLEGTTGTGHINGHTVFTLKEADTVTDNTAAALTTVQWINNLRLAFNAPPLNPSQVQMVAYGLGETNTTLQGTASWYGPYFHGRQTATGEIFDQEDLTAAHKTLPFGTYLEVRNLLNGKTIVVRINDRGPYIGERSLDLSYAAARCLGSDHVGVIPYEATVLTAGLPQAWQVAEHEPPLP
jgi:rare lipoprotein A (peptidoglycan hydrolase)